MKARIHRGAVEVGGSCLELLASNGERLLIDLGLPLAAEPGDVLSLPGVDGLTGGADPSLLGVVVSHAHPDHYGLIGSAPEDLPLYMGEATSRILKEASFFTPLGLDHKPAGTLADREPLQIGPFAVTPFLVDHSAFDSYALLVEADVRRLFYSGDFRGHGRKATLFDRLLDQPPQPVHALVLEGTTIGRPNQADEPKTEREVEKQCVELFQATPGMVLACYSPQNVDRLVSVYRAAVRAGRSLVLDLYAAAIAAATGYRSIPQANWDDIRVYVPQSQRVRVKESKEFWRVNDLGPSRIFTEELAADPSRWVMSFRTSMAGELERDQCLEGAKAVWMMWPGYLEGETGETTREIFRHLGIELTLNHASGHATVADLQRLAAAISADKVIPIHTAAPQSFASLFENVELRSDGELWEV